MWWPSGVVAFCYSCLDPPPHHHKTIPEGLLKSGCHQTRWQPNQKAPNQKATLNQKATKPEGPRPGTPRPGTPHTRHTPLGDLLQGMLGYLLQCMLGYTPPPSVNRIAHTCKNITLATTSLQPVITHVQSALVKY